MATINNVAVCLLDFRKCVCSTSTTTKIPVVNHANFVKNGIVLYLRVLDLFFLDEHSAVIAFRLVVIVYLIQMTVQKRYLFEFDDVSH